MLCDPGVVKRNNDNCLPIPLAASQALKTSGDASEKLGGNIADPSDPSLSYCVRCFVWRKGDAHHCRLCQRCVRKFDHHCSVFGRCIAGSGFKGNMKYFVTIKVFGMLGMCTAVV